MCFTSFKLNLGSTTKVNKNKVGNFSQYFLNLAFIAYKILENRKCFVPIEIIKNIIKMSKNKWIGRIIYA